MSRRVDHRLIRAVPAVRTLLTGLRAMQVVAGVLTVAQASILAELVASIVLRDGRRVVEPLILLGLVGVGRAALAAGQEWTVARASLDTRAALRRAVLGSVTALGPLWVARQPSGRLVTATGPGLEALDGYLTRAVPAQVSAGIVPVMVLARIGLADWQSAAVLIVTVPLVPVFMVLIGVTTRRRMDAQYATLSRLAGHFLDLVQGLTTLKVYGQARRQVETVRSATDDYRRTTLATLRVAFLSGLVLDLIATLSVAVVAVDVGLRLDHGSLDLQTALLVLLLAPELFAPLRAVGAQYHAAEEGRVAAAAALDILDEAPSREEIAVTEPVRATGELSIRGLVVRYPDRDQAALARLDLDVAPGEIVAIGGTSGGGKSTLLATLLRFVEPAGGSIHIGMAAGALDLALIDADRWRANVAWVPQRPVPTQRTVGSDVALGDPSATPAQVASAITACHAPHAETLLGQDGADISAGQRRRVALARMLLRARAVQAGGSVPLVLLDEPSEDLDTDTEQLVAAVISSLAGWATVVMVTHSAALARVADRCVQLVAGRVVTERRQPRVSVGVVSAAAATPPALVRPATDAAPVRLGELFDGARTMRRRLLGAALLSGAAGLAGLALTATSIWLICRAAQHPNIQALAIAVVGVRTFAMLRALLRYAERLLSHDVALRILADVRARVFAALEPLAPSGLSAFRRGDLLRRFVSDVDLAQEGLVRAVLPLSGAAITATAAIALASVLAPGAGLVLAVGLITGVCVVPVLTHRAAGDATAVADAVGRRDQRSTALLDGLAELAAYGAANHAVSEIAEAERHIVHASRRPARAAAAGAGLGALTSALVLPAVLAAAASSVAAGSLSPIAVGVVLACVLVGFDALAPLPSAFAAWSRFRAGLARVGALLATPAPMPDPAIDVAPLAGPVGLDVHAASIAPALDAPLVLRGANLVLRAGERIAVMGPSGCGKSTLLTAALRLLPTRAGSIDITSDEGRTPLTQLAADAVPPLVAGSLQGDHVFNTTLRDNLRVVRPAAGDEALDDVAARAGLRDFVDDLPRGWSTPAGPNGAALSGGQRQRLLLARALLADPAVLVLDEPTAHLDVDTERAVLRDLLTGTRGRTVLLSTHRDLPDGELDDIVTVRNGSLTSARRPTEVLTGALVT